MRAPRRGESNRPERGAAPDSWERHRLGPYELIHELASGGMATVYLARQLGAAGFERLVVLKRIHRHLAGDEVLRSMFIDEARLASQIRHPNVVPVTDVVEFEGELFLVMDYVESSAFSALLRRVKDRGERLPTAVAARIIVDTLSGLHAAHEASDMRGQRLDIVHRDVSPQNIIIGVDGISRVIDFGIAKAKRRITKTESGIIKGKFRYVAPESLLGTPLDRRADLFAVGAVLFEALAGRPLFRGGNDVETLRQISEYKLSPEPLVAGLPVALDAVLRRVLDREPENRFQTAIEFRDALEAAVPVAPASKVMAELERHCGEQLESRRKGLVTLIDGASIEDLDGSELIDDVEPYDADSYRGVASQRGTPRSVASQRGTPRGVASQRGGTPRSVASQRGGTPRSGPGTPFGTARSASAFLPRPPLVDGEGEIASQIAASHDVVVNGRRNVKRAVVVAAALAACALVALVALRSNPAPSSLAESRVEATSPGSTPEVGAAAAAAAGRAPETGDVELVLVGAQPIERVKVDGLRRYISNGAQARVLLAPWQGSLRVSATLVGGRTAVADVESSAITAGAPLTVKLAADERAPARTAPARTAPARPAPARPAANKAPPAPTATPELHNNPYAQP